MLLRFVLVAGSCCFLFWWVGVVVLCFGGWVFLYFVLVGGCCGPLSWWVGVVALYFGGWELLPCRSFWWVTTR